jgi:CheY-like chemotaxis protein
MKDSAEDLEIVGAPVLPFRLRLAAALVRMAARWLRAAHSFATVVVEDETDDANALTKTAAGAKAAASSATEHARAPEQSHEVIVALSPLMTDISELVAHLDIRVEIVIDPAVDPQVARRIDLVALVESLPKLCFALAEFRGDGPARLSLAPDPTGGRDGLALSGAMAQGPAAALIELARIPFQAPRAADGEVAETDAIRLNMHESEAAQSVPPASMSPKRSFVRHTGEIGGPFGPVDAPWIAIVERSPAAKMILEDLSRDLPIVARVADAPDEIDAAILAHPELRGVLFDPSERGVDWNDLLARITAAGDGRVKPIAMARCSTAQAEAYRQAGFALVVEKPISAHTLQEAAAVCVD